MRFPIRTDAVLCERFVGERHRALLPEFTLPAVVAAASPILRIRRECFQKIPLAVSFWHGDHRQAPDTEARGTATALRCSSGIVVRMHSRSALRSSQQTHSGNATQQLKLNELCSIKLQR